MKKATIIIILASLVNLTCFSQNEKDDKHKIGFSAALQSTNLDIMLPLKISSKTRIIPAIMFTTAYRAGTDIGLGLMYLRYMNQEKLRPYWGIRGGVFFFNPKNSAQDNQMDFLAGLAIGGEYFISESFSISIEPQFNYTLSDEESDRFGNMDGSSFNTGTLVKASIYF